MGRDLPNDSMAQKSINGASLPQEQHQNGSQVENEPPPVVFLSGRVGKGSEVNGRYELSSQVLNGRPVYAMRSSSFACFMPMVFGQ